MHSLSALANFVVVLNHINVLLLHSKEWPQR